MSFLSIPFRRATLLQKTSKPTQFFTKSYSSSSSTTAAATTSKVATTDPQALTGYRKYAQQFKNKPGSYLTTFAILHEVTAVAPFPFIYFALDHSEVKIPFPDAVVAEGNKFINKARVYYKYPPLEPDNRVMMNLVTTYCIVKVRRKKKTLRSFCIYV